MVYIVIDFETFFDPKDGYTLRKLSYPEYIADERFKVHVLGVEFNGRKKYLWGDKAINEWLDGWRNYEGDYAFVMHNAYFDAAILRWHYKFTPKYMVDTLLLANHVLGAAKDSGAGNSLAELARRLGIPAKGRIEFMEGVRDPSPEQMAALETYLAGDLDITRKVLDYLLPYVSNPDVELWLLDHTLQLYATRPLILNFDTVARAEKLIDERRQAALDRLLKANVRTFKDLDEVRDMLASNAQFEQVLREQLERYNQPMPMKKRPTTAAEKVKHLKQKTNIQLAKAGPPADVVANGEKAVKKWKRWADKVLATEHLVPEKLAEFKEVPALSKQDEEFIRLSFSPFEGIAALVSARLIERSSDTSASRLAKMRKVAGGFGVMPVHLIYYGAHTGRWAGGGGFNFQNLTNPDRASDPGQKAIAGAIRESFEAPPGYVFVAADASQIEARVNAWISGQWDLLEQFARKDDVYSLFISKVLGREIRKPKDSDPEEVYSDLKLMRHVGKESVLGLGYSMGAPKFQARLRMVPEVAKLFVDGTLDDEFCRATVAKYRELNPAIVRTWDALNNAFFVAKDGGIRQVGPVTFKRGKPLAGSKLPVVEVHLPSGRILYYRDIRKEAGKNKRPGSGGFEWKHGNGQRIYGGLLLENVTQAISRDILVETIIRVETEYGGGGKLPVVLHVHDSIVTLAPEERGQEVLDFMIRSLRTNPAWAGNRLVLDAEGKFSKTLVT